jgi:hypothetical protein
MAGMEFATDCIAAFENFHLTLVALNRETKRNLDYRFTRANNKLARLTQFLKLAFSLVLKIVSKFSKLKNPPTLVGV